MSRIAIEEHLQETKLECATQKLILKSWYEVLEL